MCMPVKSIILCDPVYVVARLARERTKNTHIYIFLFVSFQVWNIAWQSMQMEESRWDKKSWKKFFHNYLLLITYVI